MAYRSRALAHGRVSRRFAEAEKTIAATCAKHGVIPGYWNGDIEGKGKMGFRFLVVDGDVMAMHVRGSRGRADGSGLTALGCWNGRDGGRVGAGAAPWCHELGDLTSLLVARAQDALSASLKDKKEKIASLGY